MSQLHCIDCVTDAHNGVHSVLRLDSVPHVLGSEQVDYIIYIVNLALVICHIGHILFTVTVPSNSLQSGLKSQK